MENKSNHNNKLNNVKDLLHSALDFIIRGGFFILKAVTYTYAAIALFIAAVGGIIKFMYLASIVFLFGLFLHIGLMLSNPTYADFMSPRGLANHHTEEAMVKAIIDKKNESPFWRDHSKIKIKKDRVVKRDSIFAVRYRIDSVEDIDCFIDPTFAPFGTVSACRKPTSTPRTTFYVTAVSEKLKYGWDLKLIQDNNSTYIESY